MRHTPLVLLASVVGLMTVGLSSGVRAEAPADTTTYSLEQFGPITTPAEANAALQKAKAEIIAKGGGVLLIPATAPKEWAVPDNISQEAWRNPPPPAAATSWGTTPGITIVDTRGNSTAVYLPQLTGLSLSRTLNLPQGQGIGHWGTYPMLRINSYVLRGTGSHRDWLIDGVKAGKDVRFYVRSIRGIFPGMFINCGETTGSLARLYVKTLGYDKEKSAWYFTADTDVDFPATPTTALLSQKHDAALINMNSASHAEDQTLHVYLGRQKYSQGDDYLFRGDFGYMSDVHSTGGDENGVIYGAFSYSLMDIFRAKVEAHNTQDQEVKFSGATRADTLGNGRPLINLNPKKWITGGAVLIGRAARAMDDRKDYREPVYQGKTYPTTIVTGEHSGIPELRIGGFIRFTKDAPITAQVVGRYFAVDEKDEYVPSGAQVRRWYLIDSLVMNADGTRDIKIIRHWWGAKAAGAPALYNPENYTQDSHVKPLRYIIAPGANVYDVSRAAEDTGGWWGGAANSHGAREPVLQVAPSPDDGTPFDFASGDPVEQAIGSDPFHPVPFRSWSYDAIPSPYPSPIFEVFNYGSVSRYSVLLAGGGPASMTDVVQRADKKPPWESVLRIDSACGNGIIFAADTADSALLFRQPNNRAQPISWLYNDERKKATLTVSPQDGALTYQGGSAAFPGGVRQVSGLSGSTTGARNLRGVALPVPAGAKTFTVTFPSAEADNKYAIFLELSWLTNHAITHKTGKGFVIQFAVPAGKGDTVSWLLVR